MKRKHIERKKKTLFILSCIVVFMTVYSLVLPAITINKETAEEDNGIVLIDDNNAVSNNEDSVVDSENADNQAGDSSAFSNQSGNTENNTKEFNELLKEEQEKEKQMADKDSYPSVSFSDTLNDAIVRVSAPEGAFPEGTVMKIEEVEEDLSETLTDVVDNKPIESYKAIDISFYIGEEKIEPLVPIEVSITSSFIAEEPKDPLLVHIDDKGSTDLIETKQIEEKDVQAINDDEEVKDLVESVDQIDEISKDNTLSFESGSFSVYVLVYTVDFHYEVDGKVFDYSIDGGNAIALSELLDVLNVLKGSDNGKDISDFLNDIESVSFSDKSLIKILPVEQDIIYEELIGLYDLDIEYSSSLSNEDIDSINSKQFHEGDYALISLRPFDSEELLIITLKDNEIMEIKVTDSQLKKTVISASGKTYEITLTYDKQALIPEGSTLNVKEILEGDEGYQDYYDRSLEMTKDDSLIPASQEDLENNSYIRIFDIEILHEGKKIEPASEVLVSIDLLDNYDDCSNLKIVHFGDNGPEMIQNDSYNYSEKSDPVLCFSSSEFSVYSVVDPNTNLDGKPFALVTGIANDPGATTGYSETWGRDYFTIIVNAHAVSNTVNGSGISSSGVHTWQDGDQSYAGGEVSKWTFESAGNGKYYLSVIDKNGNKKYLIRKGRFDWDASIGDLNNGNREYSQYVVSSNGDGTALIYYDGGSYEQRYYLYNDGDGEWATRVYKFRNTNVNTNSSAYRFKLCEESDDFDSFAAKKTSASTITTNANYIIYRKFEDEAGNETLYALAHDGTFVRVYDGGDTIYWRETDKNLYWNYQMDGNYPVIFSQDPVSHKTVYINPNHTTGQTLSETANGLTLIGKDKGEYGTEIECWDQKAYDYAGLHVTLNGDNASLSTGTRVAGTSDTFLFAVASQMPGAVAETVDTVDSDSLGIKITMFDYGDPKGSYNAGDKLIGMTNVAGSAEYTPHAAHALVKGYLVNGLPSGGNGSMTGLFSTNGSEVTAFKENVNHLFLQSYYDENGTFRYRSEDNYAYIPFNPDTRTITSNDFIVYRQAATPYTSNINVGHTYYHHGHFMPFNDIDMNNNLSRLMNQYGNDYQNGEVIGEIPIGDGRTYESVYGVQGIPNFYTGMKMEANFTQPRNGKLENGDDMIFKFSGDDDMWVYIDGILVLDIGGIHEPLSGTINFATGIVTNPTGSSLEGQKTLYEIFQSILNNSNTPQEVKDKIGSITWKDVDGDGKPDTFADYTNHSFSAFYMERGAGASNLDIQFNLKVVLSNQFVVEKEVPDNVDPRFVNQSYKFRATYKDATDNNNEKPLYAGAKNKENKTVCTEVVYKDKKDDQGNPIAVPVDEDGYFYLKAGDAAIFKMKDESIEYNIKEVDINNYNLEKITINGDEIVDHVEINDQQAQIINNQAIAGYDMVADRSNVLYTNYPKTQNLLITKHISEDSAPMVEGENPVFEFRVYLESTIDNQDGTSTQKLIPYSYGPYYLIKKIEGVTHYFTLTGVNNAPVDKGTRPIVCSTTGRSGSINSIPPEYTIVIPDLTIGTNFYLEERRDNIPEGYEFVKEELKEGTFDDSNMDTSTDEAIHRVIARDETDHQEFDPETIGRVKDSVDAESHVYNRKPGVIVTVKKIWEPLPSEEDAYIVVELHRYAKITKGAISVTLYDNNDSPIEGAVFELYKLNEETEEFEPTSEEVTTNVNGIAFVKNLEPGSYKLVQKSTPTGYSMEGHITETKPLTVLDNTSEPQHLNYRLTNTALVTAGKVTLTVTDSGAGSGTDGTPISNATFDLYKDNTLYKTEYKTNNVGQIVAGNLPAGEYYFVQTSTTENYNLPNVTRTESFTVREAPGETQTFELNKVNDLKGKGTVSLLLKKDNEEPISNASFQLRQGDSIIETKITNDDGTLSFDTAIFEGIYIVHQVDTGSAGSDYGLANDQSVTIESNSITTQHKNLTFVNEEAGGNVTIKLWRKQGIGQWNWELVNTYEGLKTGQTYSFKATFKQGLYPGHIWFYSDSRDHINSDSIGQDLLVNLDSSNIGDNNSSYTFTFTPQQNETTYSLVLVSEWGINDIYNMEMLSATSSNFINPNSVRSNFGLRSLSLTNLKATSEVSESTVHHNADPKSAPDGYVTDSEFVETVTITAENNWTRTFDVQDKYDAEGNPYYYYVVETEHSGEDYWIDSYVGDLLSKTGTITITNKQDKVNFDVLKVAEGTTKPLSGAIFIAHQINNHVDAKYIGDEIKSDPEITEKDGRVTFENINAGYYEIKETKTPDGYIITGNAAFYIQVKDNTVKLLKKIINEDGSVSYIEAGKDEKIGNATLIVDGNSITVKVENTVGVALPSTGGAGKGIFQSAGILIALLSGAMLLIQREKRIV